MAQPGANTLTRRPPTTREPTVRMLYRLESKRPSTPELRPPCQRNLTHHSCVQQTRHRPQTIRLPRNGLLLATGVCARRSSEVSGPVCMRSMMCFTMPRKVRQILAQSVEGCGATFTMAVGTLLGQFDMYPGGTTQKGPASIQESLARLPDLQCKHARLKRIRSWKWWSRPMTTTDFDRHARRAHELPCKATST